MVLVELVSAKRLVDPTSQKSSQICRRMCQLILLVIAPLQCDEDAQIVRSSYHPDASTGELCTNLVEASGYDTLLRAVDVEG